MRHVTIASFGAALGVSGSRLVVTENGQSWETALSRLRTIRVEKKGVSVSSNLILECAARGIRLYFVDWRGVGVAAVSGLHQHAVVSVRQTALELETAAESLRLGPKKGVKEWSNILMGLEGSAATIYWQALRETGFLPPSFCQREGRGSVEIGNAALNYGYAVLQSYVWSALDNAGLELYAGVLHTKRPGKPALVLDFMEEYRAWVVDRNIIKLRRRLEACGDKGLTTELKMLIVNAIDETMATSIAWHKKSVRLENVLQRQAYRLAGAMVSGKTYRGIRFRW